LFHEFGFRVSDLSHFLLSFKDGHDNATVFLDEIVRCDPQVARAISEDASIAGAAFCTPFIEWYCQQEGAHRHLFDGTPAAPTRHPNHNKTNVLHYATRISGASCSAWPDLIAESGIDVNAQSEPDDGMTPLGIACARLEESMVENLCRAGADVSIPMQRDGTLPIMVALHSDGAFRRARLDALQRTLSHLLNHGAQLYDEAFEVIISRRQLGFPFLSELVRLSETQVSHKLLLGACDYALRFKCRKTLDGAIQCASDGYHHTLDAVMFVEDSALKQVNDACWPWPVTSTTTTTTINTDPSISTNIIQVACSHPSHWLLLTRCFETLFRFHVSTNTPLSELASSALDEMEIRMKQRLRCELLCMVSSLVLTLDELNDCGAPLLTARHLEWIDFVVRYGAIGRMAHENTTNCLVVRYVDWHNNVLYTCEVLSSTFFFFFSFLLFFFRLVDCFCSILSQM
jgi:hypothetical protein